MDDFDLARKMYADAIDYERSAEHLSRYMDHKLAPPLLNILSLEILLKCAQLIDQHWIKPSHNYKEIWMEISIDSRLAILAEAEKRYPGHADLSKLDVAFEAWKKVFVKGRYNYEINRYRSSTEIRELEEKWEASGFSPEEADLAFYPMERDSLSFGLKEWLNQKVPSLT